MMQVSHNELVVLSAKAFDGLHRHCGESDMIANMVADLEMAGLNGVQHFVNALAFMKNENDGPVQVDAFTGSQLTANLHGCSILCHLPTLLDYTIEKLVDKPTITLHIEQCHNRWLAFGELVKLAGKGLSVKAQWYNGSDPKHVVYVLNAGYILPDIYLSTADPTMNKHSLTIEISKTPIPQPTVTEHHQHISSASLAAAKQHAWQHGVTVKKSDWLKIKQTAGGILVESSDASRLGAGESHLPCA
ncbi:MAG: DUF3726 domain-containing protein [Photobacterium frigidiphilum]|uniref:DUF3726 domain-containing protein n=1 Tax=Photobacterium frigidiphilum TaxID=264736 RepID=A0A2T3JL91_9GAMM|nr:DUF3726 domain-containing protein [Photobacterium frigidiphilum]PSU49797.1 DUF3726 domain-containing protein [Photobacterium frigidiphilum]